MGSPEKNQTGKSAAQKAPLICCYEYSRSQFRTMKALPERRN
jgi:DUF1680 family protein